MFHKHRVLVLQDEKNSGDLLHSNVNALACTLGNE